MTVWDDLGSHAADLASWSEARETWTPVQLAEELWLRKLVDTREDLDRYRSDIHAELAALESAHVDAAAGEQQLVHEAIMLGRLKRVLLALDELDYAIFNAVAARLAMAEDLRQRARIAGDLE